MKVINISKAFLLTIICAFLVMTPGFVAKAASTGSYSKNAISLNGQANTRFAAANRTFNASTPMLSAFWDSNNKYHVAYEYIDQGNFKSIIVQRYNDKLQLEATVTIEKELPLFGNITTDGQYYYVVWGQNDTEATKQTTVTCAAKYSFDGKKISCLELTGADSAPYGLESGTKLPFNAGSCKLAIQEGILVCHYARQMYSGHQSDYVFYVDTNTMERVFYYVPYSSHSFDQAVLATADGGYLYASHGDAYQRGFDINYYNPVGRVGKATTFHFREGANRDHGYNETYAQLGGLVELPNGYVLCGSSEKTLSYDTAPTDGVYCGHGEARNLFVQVLKKDFYNYSNVDMYAVAGETRAATGTAPTDALTSLYLKNGTVDYGVIWLTNYSADYYVNNPKIVTTDDSRVVILWEKLSYSTHTGTTYFAVYDKNMNVLQEATELPNTYLTGNSELSIKDNKICWTTCDDKGKYIRCLDVSTGSADFAKQTASFKDYSISLAGDIQLNFYIELSEGLKNNLNTSVVFTNAGKQTTIKACALEPEANGYYKFSCPVAAAQMCNDITAEVKCKDYSYGKSTYSVAKYANYILANQSTNQSYMDSVDMVKSMLNYGGYAQKYFNYNTSNLANNGIYTNDTDPVLTQNVDLNIYWYDNWYILESDKLKYRGMSLVCENNTKLKFYFDYVNGSNYQDVMKSYDFYVTSNDNTTYEDENGSLVITVDGISAMDLGNDFSIDAYTVNGYDNVIWLSYSPMHYISKAIDSSDIPLSNLCKAMYFYNKAAKEFE